MSRLYSIDQLQKLIAAGETDWKKYGEVSAVYHHKHRMVLFNYTQAAQYADRWNWFERVSRGLILDSSTGALVAQPFPKFWNWGERTTDAMLVEATEKMDGSLGILYRTGSVGNWDYRIATRGAFESAQALWATEYLNTHYNLTGLPNDLTLLFEIIYPENRVVVDYHGFEGLILIGAIELVHGRDLLYQECKVIADQFGFMQPKVYTFDSIRAALNLAAEIDANQEGWVLRFHDGQRFKVKGEAYRLAHKLMTGISFNRVLEAMQAGTFEQMIEGAPDEFLVTIKQYREEIQTTVDAIRLRVDKAFVQAPVKNRKMFALWCKEHCPDDLGYMFTLFDNKDLVAAIFKHAFKERSIP